MKVEDYGLTPVHNHAIKLILAMLKGHNGNGLLSGIDRYKNLRERITSCAEAYSDNLPEYWSAVRRGLLLKEPYDYATSDIHAVLYGVNLRHYDVIKCLRDQAVELIGVASEIRRFNKEEAVETAKTNTQDMKND